MTIELNADTCALAVVVAAQSYGDHPVKALTTHRGMLRRSLAAAAHALVEGTGADVAQVCGVLGSSVATFKAAERDNALSFQIARHAAFKAIAPNIRARWDRPLQPSAPAPTAAPVDHSAAIREALQRRRSAVVVVGVEQDKANLTRAGAGGCRWHLHSSIAETVCDEPVVRGRLFCTEHCVATGQKTTPVELAPAVMPARYCDRGAR